MLTAGLCALASVAQAAEFRPIEIPADRQGPAIKGAIWSPCPVECPPGTKHPLIVISHGRGGNFLGHLDTAEALAKAGFIVVGLNHPGDTVSDMSHFYDLSVYFDRPRDIRRAIDFMLGASTAAPFIDPARIGLFGFSRGGYTGRATIGGEIDWPATTERCRSLATPPKVCQQILALKSPAEPLTHDTRVRAAVIADPPATMFGSTGLAAIKVPMQLWASQLGGDGVLPKDVAAAEQSLRGPHEFHVVANAGHFAFLAPCPAALAAARPELCTDQPGFDRAAFHAELNAAVVAFLHKHLGAAAGPDVASPRQAATRSTSRLPCR
jgi:predicted dienelactone hydrolase